jgi:6-phosphogluconolactonase (cycloisomerase 2 family)
MYAHVGTFTTWDDQPSEGIYSFAVDPADGALELVGVTALADPTFLAASSRGMLYAATHTSSFDGAPGAGLVAFAAGEDGSLRRLGQARVPSPHPVYVGLDRTERHVLVASGLGGAASGYAVGEDGVPSVATSVLALPGEPSIPLGGLLLVANQESGDVRAYRVDEQTGTVKAIGARTPVPCPVCVRLIGP